MLNLYIIFYIINNIKNNNNNNNNKKYINKYIYKYINNIINTINNIINCKMLCAICKKYKEPIFCLSNRLLCANHSKILFNSEISTIQKIYRGYKVRKYLKNIFNRLPRDLQNHILGFNDKSGKEDKINRINKYLHKITYKINNFSNIRSHIITIKELENILAFILKHNSIIDCRWKNYYYYYFKNICYIFLLIQNSDTIPTHITYIPSYISISIFNSINFQPNIANDDVYLKINKLLESVYVFLNS
jgi:hypothetical protein